MEVGRSRGQMAKEEERHFFGLSRVKTGQTTRRERVYCGGKVDNRRASPAGRKASLGPGARGRVGAPRRTRPRARGGTRASAAIAGRARFARARRGSRRAGSANRGTLRVDRRDIPGPWLAVARGSVFACHRFARVRGARAARSRAGGAASSRRGAARALESSRDRGRGRVRVAPGGGADGGGRWARDGRSYLEGGAAAGHLLGRHRGDAGPLKADLEEPTRAGLTAAIDMVTAAIAKSGE